MELEVTNEIAADGIRLIKVRGEFDLAAITRVEPLVDAAIEDPRPVCVDLSECPFIDSSGLRLVLRLYRELGKEGNDGKALAVVTHPGIRKLFSVTAIDLSVPVFDSQAEALAWLGGDRLANPGR